MESTDAISRFKKAFRMYANVELTTLQTQKGWEIYLPGVKNPIGIVRQDGTPELY